MKPSIPKGTRDFSPAEMLRRNYIFGVIRDVFQQYGFLPLETPAMENLSTLMGKYGEEGDKLIFKILNSGNYFSAFENDDQLLSAKSKGEQSFSTFISEKALRYDLTVPFARYVVMHQHDITFPFRRYQIQPVWRADRPQKGRYREFYQCDADVIGTDSLLCELDLIKLTDDVFNKLGLGIKILINNRKILSGIAETIGAGEKLIDITVAIDKLDKIGLEKVKDELLARGLNQDALKQLEPLLVFKGNSKEKLNFLESMIAGSDNGKEGIDEVKKIFSYLESLPLKKASLEVDLTLARGLNYYTGAILEVKVDDTRSSFGGSICGGGRYDDLTGIFGLKGMSGVGISFGADRIYDVLEECGLFPDHETDSTKVMIANFSDDDLPYALNILSILREANIPSEIYPDTQKMKKQFAYADARKIPYVILAGSDERKSGVVAVKNLLTGNQEMIAANELVEYFKEK
jgi:histidyl-tRNA synthetase